MARTSSVYSSDSDKRFYDSEEPKPFEEHSAWMDEIQFYFHKYAVDLDNFLEGTNGLVAELGAGSCGLSLSLSKLKNVSQVTALDISTTRMKKMVDLSYRVIGGNLEKVDLKSCDFNKPLPLEDEKLDAIVFDASLHHSRSIWATLGDCNRVLKPGGFLVAQRESYLNMFRAKHQLANLLKSPEIAANVSENMYLLEQYIYYLKVSGFDVTFIKASKSPLKAFLSPLNGLLFCDGILMGRKANS